MKKSVSELSLTVITITAIVAISSFLILFLTNSQNFLIEKINDLFQIGTTKYEKDLNDEADLKNKVILSDSVDLSKSENDISKLFSNSIELDNSFSKLDSKLESKLQKLTKSNIKKIKDDKALNCIDECKIPENLKNNDENEYQYQFFSFDSYYVANVSSTSTQSKNEYSFIYEEKTGLFGTKSYNLVSVSDDNIKEKKEKAIELSEKEIEEVEINYDYDDSYISKATVDSSNISFQKDKSLADTIYQNNLDCIVMLNTYNNEVITNTATGFFVSPGIIATSFKYLKDSLVKGNFISALTNSEKSYPIQGVVMLDNNSDIALLKVETEIGKSVVFEENMEESSEILMLGTFGGFGISGQVGRNLSNSNLQTNLLYTTFTNIGSPLFNTDGNVVGMVTSNSNQKKLSYAVSSKILNKYVKLVKTQNFNEMTYYTLSELSKKYYLYDLQPEQSVDTIASTIFQQYKSIGDIETSITLRRVKSNSFDNGISLRYINDTNLENDDIIQNFINNLLEENYKLELNSQKKKKYLNLNYRVTIFYDFNYITILIEKVQK